MTKAPRSTTRGRRSTRIEVKPLDDAVRGASRTGCRALSLERRRHPLRLVEDPSRAATCSARFAALAEARGLRRARATPCSPARSSTRPRAAPATHVAERGQGAPRRRRRSPRSCHQRMRSAGRRDRGRGVRRGPRHPPHRHRRLGARARTADRRARPRRRPLRGPRSLSNIDGAGARRGGRPGSIPAATLVVACRRPSPPPRRCSTSTPRSNGWSEDGVDDPYGRVIAVTASPDAAVEFGIDETRILPFAEGVGGRYSLWSSVGFPAALALGWEAFEELLEGAATMDRHFRLRRAGGQCAAARRLRRPALHASGCGAETRAVFAYDERLRLLPSYLQQLEMESNGKSVTRRRHSRWAAPTRADHLGRGRHRRPACGVPVAPPGHAPRAGRIRRGDRAERRPGPGAITACCCSTASPRARR